MSDRASTRKFNDMPGAGYLKRRGEEVTNRAGAIVNKGVDALRNQAKIIQERGERLYGSR